MIDFVQDSRRWKMQKRKIRIIPFLLALCMFFTTAVLPAGAANPGGVEYINTHVNTGNQREDILAVAFTQLGYMEKVENDTKYGDWLGYPFQPWCASFVSWCARQADISTDILNDSPRANPTSFGIKSYHGKNYTPKPGDLFFTEEYTHVGIVWYVEGDFFYCIEGNAKYHDYQVPDDPEVDSYYVMTNKRLISAHYFGVPAYEGCDKDHTYIKGTESAHPHKTYYQCTACGDKYYTGYTAVKPGCGSCYACGCSSSSKGYYLMSTTAGPIRIRTTHSTSADYVGYVSDGAVVYVHGMSYGWAYIEYDGLRGHIKAKYLTKYHDVPASPTLSADRTKYVVGDDAVITWNAPANTEQYRLKVYRDGVLYKEQTLGLTRTFTMTDLPVGEYEVQVIACNRSGASAAGKVKLTVLDTYTLTYDAAGGTGAPAAQTQAEGDSVTVSNTVPVRAGYTFLGWNMEKTGKFARYVGGDILSAYDDLTLYAVWKRDDATLAEMTISRLPASLIYLKGEELDTTGLALELTYSDGTGHIVTEGYTTAGFESETYGTKTVTVAYDTLTAAYEVEVVPYLPGDIDLNKTVNRDDVMQLLWHISFPAEFPIRVPADFTGDGTVNRDDVMQLLWHISFPDQFPLEVEWEEEALPTEPEAPTEPEEPTEPEAPTETEQPTESEEPTEPEASTEPEEPTEPEESTEPEASTEPAEATEPEEPTNPAEGE